MYQQLVAAFELSAKKKGYSLDREDITGRYEDVWLQEAWEIFFLIDLEPLIISQHRS